MQKLASCKYERTIRNMANDMQSESKAVLDLSTAAANPINRVIAHIGTLYKSDFPPEITPESSKLLQHALTPGLGSSDSVSVRMQAEELSEADYANRLEVWNGLVAKHAEREYSSFINDRIAWVVDDLTDPVRVGRKCEKVNILRENKRKLYLWNESISKPMPWDKMKKTKEEHVSLLRCGLRGGLIGPPDRDLFQDQEHRRHRITGHSGNGPPGLTARHTFQQMPRHGLQKDEEPDAQASAPEDRDN